jgi:hypothetical protein
MVGKHCGTRAAGVGVGEQALKIVPVKKNVVAQRQGRRVVADEICTNGESLRQPVGAGLRKTRRVLRRADEQDVANARQHQRAERVIDHGFVVHRQQLLAYGQSGRVQAGDSLHALRLGPVYFGKFSRA